VTPALLAVLLLARPPSAVSADAPELADPTRLAERASPTLAPTRPWAPEVARARYADSRAELEAARRRHARAMAVARGPAARRAVLAAARRDLQASLRERLIPAWTGTPWAMNGISDAPGEGHIACGVYVGTVLAHAGFAVNRVRLGQLASEHIGLALAGPSQLRRWSNRPAAEVVDALVAWGPGLYLVGLDLHAGLAWVDPSGEARFLHSSYVGEGTVVDEPLLGENPFGSSRYRVLARLLDDRMMTTWLEGRRIDTTPPPRRRRR
jgi:hypothetical protein